MKILFRISIILLFFSGCKTESNNQNTENKRAFKVSFDLRNSLDTVQKRLLVNSDKVIFRDKNYIVTNYDFGEWGGYIAFKDLTTKYRYVYPATTVYQIGKIGNEYIVFSHSRHSGIGAIMQLKPSELYKLPDTTKVFTKQLQDNISQYFTASKHKGVLRYTDEKDSLLSVVGIFTNNNKIYAVQANWFFAEDIKEHSNTIISTVDLLSAKYQIMDTILNAHTHTSGIKGTTLLNVPEQIIRYEILTTNTNKIKQGGIIFKGDSLTIVEQ